MTTHPDTYAALKQVFHEPSRMALVTALSARTAGASFGELKSWCNLTDGNLNRHLKALRDAGVVRVCKVNGSARSHTQIEMTPAGKEQFLQYLQALERALQTTADTLAIPQTPTAALPLLNGSISHSFFA